MYKLAQTTLYAVILSGLLLNACGKPAPAVNEHAESEAASHRGHERNASGDLQEKTASLQMLPSFLDSASQDIVTAYRTAATVTDILPYIPCYCGCGDSAGHRSNMDCFIAEIVEDGSVVWDDHGTRCGVCMEIAVTAAAMKASGIETGRIRSIIDETYREGYAKPTDTLLPSA